MAGRAFQAFLSAYIRGDEHFGDMPARTAWRGAYATRTPPEGRPPQCFRNAEETAPEHGKAKAAESAPSPCPAGAEAKSVMNLHRARALHFKPEKAARGSFRQGGENGFNHSKKERPRGDSGRFRADGAEPAKILSRPAGTGAESPEARERESRPKDSGGNASPPRAGYFAFPPAGAFFAGAAMRTDEGWAILKDLYSPIS